MCQKVQFLNIEKHENRLKMVKNVILEGSKKGHFYVRPVWRGGEGLGTSWSKVSARSQNQPKKVR